MKIIVNKNIPQKALTKLESYGFVLPFETKGISYPAISNHPDVFMCMVDNQLIIAPNTPDEYKKLLLKNNVKFIEGDNAIGANYPNTAMYNAVVTDKYLIHNSKITDNKIIDLCTDKQTIHINQAYARCNLLPLKNDSFITSDKGIYDTLKSKKLNILFVNPNGIVLPGYDYGFFGGTCGVYENTIFILGSLNVFADGEKVSDFITALNYTVIELYNGQLFDCGSLFFIVGY